jgi:predicted nucleotidyltransferase
VHESNCLQAELKSQKSTGRNTRSYHTLFRVNVLKSARTPDSRQSGAMHPDIADKREVLAALCQRLGVARLELFGSAIRAADFDPALSDVDFPVTFAPDARDDFTAFLDFKEALEALFGRPVDLVERKAVEASRNFHPPPDSAGGRGGLWMRRRSAMPLC